MTIAEQISAEQTRNEQLRRLVALRRENARLEFCAGLTDQAMPVVARLRQIAAKEFGIPEPGIFSAGRHEPFASARMIVMALAWETGLFFQGDLARAVGVERSTISFAARTVRERCQTEAKFAARVHRIREQAGSELLSVT